MSPLRSRRVVKWLLALLLGMGAAVLLVGFLVWRYPLASLAVAGRTALRLSGFEKVSIAARPGRIVYFRAGSGTPIVFIHGANDQAGTWARVAPAFTRQHRVVILDLAGHGDSEPQAGPLTLTDLVESVSAVVAAEAHGQKVTLVGNSLGGFLALVYVLRHPDAVAQAIIVNGAIDRGNSEQAAATLLPTSREQARKTMEALTSPRSPRIPGFVLDDLVRHAPGSPLARLMAEPPESVDPYLIDDRLGEIRVPVTMIWGADDTLLSISYARRAAARMPHARLEILPDCGHMPQRECPGPLLARLRESLARVPRTGEGAPGSRFDASPAPVRPTRAVALEGV